MNSHCNAKTGKRSSTLALIALVLTFSITNESTILRKSEHHRGFLQFEVLGEPQTPEPIFEDRPVLIGILTQPKSGLNQNSFSGEQYILEVNRAFVETSGMVKAVPIKYDLAEDELYDILDKIDGVHLTGGGLDLYNFTTDQWHPYYITSKRIY